MTGAPAPGARAAALIAAAVVTAAGCAGSAPGGGHDNRGESRGSAASTTTAGATAGGAYRVLRVIDGDTVDVAYRGGTTIRPIGYDTPETYGTEECYGARATARATRLLDRDDTRPGLQGVRVTLTFDPTQGRTGKYGRTLAYIGLPDGRDLGHVMIAGGYAREYTYDEPYRRQAAYRRAERSARARDAGLWGACEHGPSPTAGSPAPTPSRDDRGGVPPPPPDLDCADVDGPVRVAAGDPHRLDRDGDGVGCDS